MMSASEAISVGSAVRITTRAPPSLSPGTGLAIVHRRLDARAPRAPADLGIGDVVLERRHLLGLGIARPESLRAAKVGDAGVGRDARAGEDDDAPRGIDPAAGSCDGALEVTQSRRRI